MEGTIRSSNASMAGRYFLGRATRRSGFDPRWQRRVRVRKNMIHWPPVMAGTPGLSAWGSGAVRARRIFFDFPLASISVSRRPKGSGIFAMGYFSGPFGADRAAIRHGQEERRARGWRSPPIPPSPLLGLGGHGRWYNDPRPWPRREDLRRVHSRRTTGTSVDKGATTAAASGCPGGYYVAICFSSFFQRPHALSRASLLALLAFGASPARIKPWPAPS